MRRELNAERMLVHAEVGMHPQVANPAAGDADFRKRHVERDRLSVAHVEEGHVATLLAVGSPSVQVVVAEKLPVASAGLVDR